LCFKNSILQLHSLGEQSEKSAVNSNSGYANEYQLLGEYYVKLSIHR